MKRQRLLIFIGIIAIILCGGWFLWIKFASPTKIALVNFQPFQTTNIIKSNKDKFIQFEEVALDQLHKLKNYDFVLAFGMGMNISVQQRSQFKKATNKGINLYIYASTNPDNDDLGNLDSVQQKTVERYLNNGNKKNYQSLGRYIRKEIDRKLLFVNDFMPLSEPICDVLYHLDENIWFDDIETYENWLKKNHFYTDNAPKIAIVGGFNDPFCGNRDNIDSLIILLQRADMNVYPVLSNRKRLDFLKKINPDAVIYLAHGQLIMGHNDSAVAWLKQQNIPLFAPLSLLQTQAEWETDPMGMSGGFMSQSIVIPELDGAIYPYVLNSQEIDADGLYMFKAIRNRLTNFIQIVANFNRLKHTDNANKRVAIYYFKGAGQSTLSSQGLETVPSLYNLLKRLKKEGYKVDNLPDNVKDFEKMLMAQGAVLNTYANGAFDDFLKNGDPALITIEEFESWMHKSLPESLYNNLIDKYGAVPGRYMSVKKNDKFYLAVARILLGNIVLLPQPMAGLGNDAFAIIHGAKSAPPYPYIAAYLWSQYAFKADAIIHFGTHGSLEFTPQKQVALCNYDWPDCLLGNMPHFYYYTIGNIGESMIAKRRTYATTISHLTPAFTESNMRTPFKKLQNKIHYYYKADKNLQTKIGFEIKKMVIQMGIHRDLDLDSLNQNPYTYEEIERIDNFAEEIANAKITGPLYISGIPYNKDKIRSTIQAMSAEPIAYSVAKLDCLNGKITDAKIKNKSFFFREYLEKAQQLVDQILNGKPVNDELICAIAQVSPKELEKTKTILSPPRRPIKDFSSFSYTYEQKNRARAIAEIERTILNIPVYQKALEISPEQEFRSLLNALNGGYVTPSSGGDVIANPAAIPTGRNLYAINAEITPGETAWENGVSLAKATLEQYRKQHGDYPDKVAYTFWSSEFIETEGATLAQVLYMLGIEPLRDAHGRITDLQLISSEQLGRPRIDVVVQTSGQFRDLASSRLALISKAVEMAAAAKNDHFTNHIAENTITIERELVKQGTPPKEAREMSSQRIFGGINGMYGTNIQSMVTSGDKWESEKEISDTYIHNMGAIYGNNKHWGQYLDGLFRAVLYNTDIVIQPRQSNTWGPLSLDHVYEFMGGITLAVRNTTGKDPETYFADYRNRNNVHLQELKEAIGVEIRSTVFNPSYITEIINGNASSAAQITEIVTNTYGWNVMKPAVIDNEIWNKFYNVYIKDEYHLGVKAFFYKENPQALQEITAVMLETVRKGIWKASHQQIADIANLHAELVTTFGSSASGFSGGNSKLQDFIATHVNTQTANKYRRQLQKMQYDNHIANASTNRLHLKKEEMTVPVSEKDTTLNVIIIAIIIIVVFVSLFIILKKKHKWNT